MGNIGYRFLLCIFDLLLAFIIFINYSIWSGAYIDLATGTAGDLTNTYFGFRSLRIMITTYGQAIDNNSTLSIKMLPSYMQGLINYALGDLPEFFKSLTSLAKDGIQASDILNAFNNFAKFFVFALASPLFAFYYLIMVICCLFYYIYNLLAIIFLAFGGFFNIHFEHPLPSTDVYRSLQMYIPAVV